ncbi:MAG: hypothetical protein LUG98_10280 [Tannerellaceae bacterium]|nr:hypothetical protein [Tannerellaceae bacterium]
METKNLKEMNHTLRRERFPLPVCIDNQGDMQQLNGFPDHLSFRTFLLDHENKVVLIGNPVLNAAMKELYLNEIRTFYTNRKPQTASNDSPLFSQGKREKSLLSIENPPHLSQLSFSGEKKKQFENTYIRF